MKEITVLELKVMLAQGSIQLIDVREQYEINICHIKGSMFIPMNEVKRTLKAFDKKNQYAIMCHSGVRSYHVANFLVNNGVNAVNVIGGINEWARCVDNSMPTY